MSLFRAINLLALILCYTVVVFGAYVRLSNAGLGCPDWPGCYGHLTVSAAARDPGEAARDFPSRPVVEAPKAWKEDDPPLPGQHAGRAAAGSRRAVLDR